MAGASNKQIEASLCENCFEVFFSKKQYTVHTEKCSELSPAVSKTGSVVSSTLSKCNHCKRIFLGSDHLESHVKRDHSTTKKEQSPKVVVMKTILQCNSCTKIFMDAALLEKHIEQMHPAPKETPATRTSPAKRPAGKWPLKTRPVKPLVPVKSVPPLDDTSTDSTEMPILAQAIDDSVNTTTPADSSVANDPVITMAPAEEITISESDNVTILAEEIAVSESMIDASVGDVVALVEDVVVSGEDVVVSGEDLVASGEDVVASGEDVVASGEDVVASGEDVVASGEDVVASGEDVADMDASVQDVDASVEDMAVSDTVTTDVHMDEAVVSDLVVEDATDDATVSDSGVSTAPVDGATVPDQINGSAPVDDQVAAEKMLMDQLTSQLEAVHGETPSSENPPTAEPEPSTTTEPAPTTPTATNSDAKSEAKASAGQEGTSRPSQTFYACSYCNMMFTSKDPLLKHLEQEHADKAARVAKKAPATKTMYACAVCDSKYATMRQVQNHIQQAHEPKPGDKSRELVGRPQESVWSTSECLKCPELRKHSVRLRDVFMNLNEWTNHYYGKHQKIERPRSGKRLFLHPCHRCGVVFMNRASRLHHNVIAHEGCDPEELMRNKKLAAEKAEKLAAAKAEQTAVEPKSLSAKARSKLIVDGLMKASLVSREVPAVPLDRVSARKQQQKAFAQHSPADNRQRLTQVVFKCSKCGGIFPDDPSFEKHAREEHGNDVIGADGDAPSADQTESTQPTEPEPEHGQVMSTLVPVDGEEEWDVLCQRECSECSKLMQSCPRSFALFVPRDVWEAHVEQVHAVARWRCTGEKLQMHPCDRCPRLFLHPTTLTAHKEKLHDAMLCDVSQEEVDACRRTDTIECSKCSQLVQNADGLRFLEGGPWQKHFEGEHKQLLLWDGNAGNWRLWACSKCHRLFFNEKDLPVHQARQAYMHMPVPANVKVTTIKGGPKTPEEMELLYQCANQECPFSTREQEEMISHSQQCSYASLATFGETVLYKTVLIKKPPKTRRVNGTRNKPLHRRLDNVLQKLHPDDSSDSMVSTTNLLQPGTAVTVQQFEGQGVIELDPVTSQPRLSIPLAVAENVPEAAGVEETVITEEQPTELAEVDEVNSEDDATHVTRMDFACGVCNQRGSSRQEIVAHIKRRHRDEDEKEMVRTGKPGRMTEKERAAQVENYTHSYLCEECKRMVLSCPKTQDLYFEKDTWLEHLRTTHQPTGYNELDRLDLHECTECPRLLLSVVSHKRHVKFYHAEGAENLQALRQKPAQVTRESKYKFRCFEEGCDFRYHRVSRIRTHLIRDHNFDLAVREVHFRSEQEFQTWKKELEMNTGSCFLLRSSITAKRRNGMFHVRYHECSRVMTHLPSSKQNGKKKSLAWQVDLLKQDMVWRCPAFLKAEVPVTTGGPTPQSIRVTFCPNHYGHEMDPTFARLSDEEESEIAQLLMAGLPIPDVMKKMREEARLDGTPSRKQRVTEAEINRIYEKYLGLKPPKHKRNYPDLPPSSFGAKAEVSRSRVQAAASGNRRSADADSRGIATVVDSSQNTEPVVSWNADFISSNVTVDNGAEGTIIAYAEDGSQYEEQEYVEETYEIDERGQNEPEPDGARDTWQRVCGEEECDFTTNSVGYLRYHLRNAHGFAMHIDTVSFPLLKHFNKWKRNLEKRTCAKYACYKTVASEDPNSPVETRYFTCHRSGLIHLRRPSVTVPLPKRLVLCTGYMKLRVNQNSGEVVCEYCASHYGHDARLVQGRPMDHVGLEMPVFETVDQVVEHVVEGEDHVVENVGHVVETVDHVVEAVDHVEVEVEEEEQPIVITSPSQYAFVTEVQQEYEVQSTPEEHNQPRPQKRAMQVRRSRGGKRRRWEEVEEMEEEQLDDEEEEQDEEDDSFESD